MLAMLISVCKHGCENAGCVRDPCVIYTGMDYLHEKVPPHVQLNLTNFVEITNGIYDIDWDILRDFQ